ncbi:MAG: response regulator [Planctomycetota bacterium]|jgi:CheY-like chemotaxis protein
MRGSEERVWRSRQLEAMGALARTAAHDINNQLTAILGFLDLARLRLPDEHDALGPLSGLQAAAEGATRMARGLLAHGCRNFAVPLDELLEGLWPLLRQLLPDRVEIVIDPARAEKMWIDTDRNCFRRLFAMLALRGRDAMPQGGHFRISNHLLEDRPGLVELRVEHGAGTGFDAEAFQEVAAEHGARILDVDASGVRIAYPLLSAPSLPYRRMSPSGKGESILLAEKNRQVRAIMAAALRAAAYQVLHAEDSPAALSLYADRVRLAILDRDLPGRGGIDCVKDLRETRPDLPAVIIGELSDAAAGAEDEGRTVFLRKPFQMAELTALVRRILSDENEEKSAAEHQGSSG